MSDLCTWCGEPIKQPEGAGRRRKFCSDECLKQKSYAGNKSVFVENGMGACGPIGLIEGEHVSTSWAGSYDEHYVDPVILAQAELNESNFIYSNEINPIDENKWTDLLEKKNIDRDFAIKIIENCDKNKEIILEKINSISSIDAKKLSLVEKSILIIAFTEILFFDDVPLKVTINEAIELAKIYGSNESYKFINGVLDKLKNSTVTS